MVPLNSPAARTASPRSRGDRPGARDKIKSMHYGILGSDGKMHHVECDRQEVDERIERLSGILSITAETREEYERKLAQDKGGKMEIW